MNKIKPTRWYYVLALLIPVFACVGTALIVYGNVPKLPGALEALGVKKRFIMNTAVSSMG